MGHLCYACDPANPHRVFSYDEGSASARFPARFSGPPGSANGGIAVGALACPASLAQNSKGIRTISARLRRPVLLDQAHQVTRGDDTANALGLGLAGESAITASTVTDTAESRAPAGSTELLAAMASVRVPDRPPFFEETGDHPIPGCFSCGPEHADGLHIYPRVVEDGVTCAPWHASAEFDDGDGAISPMIMASALDCSSGICMPIAMQRELLDEDRFFLLGSLDVHFLRRPPVERNYRVVARAGERDGRKFFGTSALFDDDGIAYAMAQATWIIAGISRTEAFGAR